MRIPIELDDGGFWKQLTAGILKYDKAIFTSKSYKKKYVHITLVRNAVGEDYLRPLCSSDFRRRGMELVDFDTEVSCKDCAKIFAKSYIEAKIKLHWISIELLEYFKIIEDCAKIVKPEDLDI